MRTRNSLSGLLILSLAAFLTDDESVADEVHNQFPTVCFLGPPAEKNELEHWQRIRDANFTIVLPSYQYSDADQLRMLDHCQRVGLKGIVNIKQLAPAGSKTSPPTQWQQQVRDAIDRYANHPALFGYMVRDEPGAELFAQLGRVAGEFKRLDPRHKVCINLFPVHATATQLQTSSYVAYLNDYLQTVQPPFLCYDHYPLLRNGSDRSDFYLNLELARAAGLKHNTPVWTVVLSGWGTLFRKPTAAELRWQVYSALAYGFKGIAYFAYWPTDDSYASIVDYAGSPQPIFESVRELNRNVQVFGKALHDATSHAVFHTGAMMPKGCARLAGDTAWVRVPQRMPLAIGQFLRPTNRRLTMIVNRDYRESYAVPIRITGTPRSVAAVGKSAGAAIQATSDNQFQLMLPAGGAVLLQWQEAR